MFANIVTDYICRGMRRNKRRPGTLPLDHAAQCVNSVVKLCEHSGRTVARIVVALWRKCAAYCVDRVTHIVESMRELTTTPALIAK